MTTNASILDQNICDAFGALAFSEVVKDAYWRFRNRDGERLSERKAWLLANAISVVHAASKHYTQFPSGERWAAVANVNDFLIERLVHADGMPEPFQMRPVSFCAAVADKADTLVGLFLAGEIPDGSGDKFALRRTANGLLRILHGGVAAEGAV